MSERTALDSRLVRESARPSSEVPASRISYGAGVALVFQREVAALVDTRIAYVAILVGLVCVSSFFMNEFFLTGRLDMTPFFDALVWVVVLLSAAISMRSWSEDLRSRTFELWMTLPLTPGQVVIGKFAAALVLHLVFLAGTLPIVGMLAWLGDPDLGAITAGYCGAVCLGAAFLALGSLASSLTSDQIVAFLTTSAWLAFLVVTGNDRVIAVVDGMSPSLGIGTFLAETVSALPHYAAFVRGVIAPASVGFFLLLAVASLWLTAWVVRHHRA